MRATDGPTEFSTEEYLKLDNISKPQYNYRIGYYLNNQWSISIGMDHMKYYMVDNQTAVLDGYISESVSEEFAGTYDNVEMTIPWDMLYVHHSDGLNYASIEIEYNYPFWQSKDQKHYLDAIANIGAGVVVPKSYVKIFEEVEDNSFHIAGGGPSAKLGFRATFWRYGFLEIAGKAGYVWMPDIIVNGRGTARADQEFGWFQTYGALGFNIPLSKQNK